MQYGSEATEAQKSHLAKVVYINRYRCGANIIANNKLVSSASCFPRPSSYYTILYKNRPFTIEKLYIHPHYIDIGEFGLFNDIAVIYTVETFGQYFKNFKMLKLADTLPAVGTICDFVSDGYTLEKNVADTTQFVQLELHNKFKCVWKGPYLRPGRFCVSPRDKEHLQAPCHNDAGSGLLLNQTFLMGMFSFGRTCLNYTEYTFFTSVPHYHKWIENPSRGSKIFDSFWFNKFFLKTTLIENYIFNRAIPFAFYLCVLHYIL